MKWILIILALFTTKLSAQDIEINFASEGNLFDIDEVIVTNLSTDQMLTIGGSESLILSQITTDIDTDKSFPKATIVPNPYSTQTNLNYRSSHPTKGFVQIANLSGKIIVSKKVFFEIGINQFKLSIAKPGLYLVHVITPKDNFSCKIIQEKPSVNSIIETTILKDDPYLLKSKSNNVLTYSSGDRISYLLKSGNLSTVVNEIPSATKTITTNFFDCIDGDNNPYPIVQIGNQWWMAENLNTTTYSNGNPIPNVTSELSWNNLENSNTSKAYCHFNNNNALEYGALYTYGATVNGATITEGNQVQGVCPDGWHVPDNTEWTELVEYLQNTGGYVGKAIAAHKGWEEYVEEEPVGPSFFAQSEEYGRVGNNQEDNNRSGFNAIPAGYRMSTGEFEGEGGAAWWSLTESDSEYAYKWGLSNESYNLWGEDTGKASGYQVRCVKD